MLRRVKVKTWRRALRARSIQDLAAKDLPLYRGFNVQREVWSADGKKKELDWADIEPYGIDTVIDLAVETMKAERGFLMLREPDGSLRFAVARNIDQAELALADLHVSKSIVERVFASGTHFIRSGSPRSLYW